MSLATTGVRLMMPRKCAVAKPATVRKAPQTAATTTTKTETTKPAMIMKGVQMTVMEPILPMMRKKLVMVATTAIMTEEAKLVIIAKDVKIAAGMMMGSISNVKWYASKCSMVRGGGELWVTCRMVVAKKGRNK